MHTTYWGGATIAVVAGVLMTSQFALSITNSYSHDEPEFDMGTSSPLVTMTAIGVSGKEIASDAPYRVGLQVGHLDNQNVPEELAALKKSNGGAEGGGYVERTVAYAIAKETAAVLEDAGVVVDILPATIPPDYRADAFVSIHADGNSSPKVSGYKIAAPRLDASKKADELSAILYDTYGKATGLSQDSTITRRMTGYYTFNWRRYTHSIHPETPAVIVETGYITSPEDREIIAKHPEVAALGIASGILQFLGVQGK